MSTRYREILRLEGLGRSKPEIAASVGCNVSTVARTLKLAKGVGLEWPLPDELDDGTLAALLHPRKYGKRGNWSDPDYEWVHRELAKKGVTRALLYEEYCDSCRDAGLDFCSQSTFNSGYAAWADSKSLTMHIDRKPGQKMEVDWAGTKMAVTDRNTGEKCDVFVFVACMPFSGKVYSEGFLSMGSECWLTANAHALEFFGGVPDEIVPDNCKTAVTSHRRGHKPVLNRAFSEFAEHYGCAVAPARVRRPKDKANVESGVGLVTRRAVAALRNRVFFTVAELNAALSEKVSEINSAPFAKKPGSRSSVFEEQEKSHLGPLPPEAFPVCSWERATVRSDYHVKAGGCFYSVPFEYIRKVVDVRVSMSTVEVFFKGVRIASHVRLRGAHEFSTDKSHMPKAHAAYLEWDEGGLSKRAEGVGASCSKAMAVILGSQKTKKKSIGQGKSLLALSGRFGAEVLEQACARALAAGGGMVCTVESVECLCKAVYRTKGDLEDSGEHAILRGAEYYRNAGGAEDGE